MYPVCRSLGGGHEELVKLCHAMNDHKTNIKVYRLLGRARIEKNQTKNERISGSTPIHLHGLCDVDSQLRSDGTVLPENSISLIKTFHCLGYCGSFRGFRDPQALQQASYAQFLNYQTGLLAAEFDHSDSCSPSDEVL